MKLCDAIQDFVYRSAVSLSLAIGWPWVGARRHASAEQCVVCCKRQRKNQNRRNLRHLLVTIWTNSGGFIVFCAIVVGTIVKSAISPPHRPPTSLILKVPIEADERPMLIAFVLQKIRTLFHSKLF